MSMEETSQNQSPQAATDPSSSSISLERRPSADEDSAAMTIEFLRARLLSERSVSKAARQRAQQLSKKISELEERLEAEIQLRKKLEADRVEIISQYRAELSEEYGELFASSFGEGLSRNESQTANEDEEGLSASRSEHLDRSDSCQRLNHEEGNDEDEETDLSGREKGVLSWGRQKGSRREFGHGTDWPGRSLSQRSIASADGESPQKKWAGKSVRQIRKRESSTFEVEPGQSLVSEDFNGKTGQSDDVKQCEDERDTEVERVLERQAELIEQFEAEENAQRAWEAKFKEAKALASCKTGINQSSSIGTLESMTKTIHLLSLAKDGATNLMEMESTKSEGSTRLSRKVHPECCPKAIQGRLVQSETFQRVASDYRNGFESENNQIVPTADVEKEAYSSTNQSKFGNTASGEQILGGGKSGDIESTMEVESPNEMITEMDPSNEDARLHEDRVLSNTDTEQAVDHSKAPATELGKSSKFKKHLSSSFRFTVFADAEPVTSTSPHMPGFAVYKQETKKVAEAEAENDRVLLSGSTAAAASEQVYGFGISDPPREPQSHVATTASLDHHPSIDQSLVSEDSTLSMNDSGSQRKAKEALHEAPYERGHSTPANGVTDRLSNHDLGNEEINDSNREDILNRTSGLRGGQDLAREHRDFSPYPESSGLGVHLQPGFGSDFPSQSSVQQSHVALKDSNGTHFGNFSGHPGNRSGVPSPIVNANSYEDTALGNQRRSVDGGFNRVADVLRALQVAKYQLESAGEQATPFAIDMPYRNGCDGREAYYGEPSHLPSMYSTPSQYTSPVTYSSRAAPPLSQNMQGWSAMPGGYRAGPLRQLANTPYMQYASRVTEPQSLWPPPPSQGIHSSNLYHYDTRQYR